MNIKLIKYFLISSLFFCCYLTIAIAKTSIVSITDDTIRKISIFSRTTNPDLTITGLNLSASYTMEVTKTSDGSNVNENSTIACGERLTFRFRPTGQAIPGSGETTSSYTNYWTVSGSSNDTPYAKWVTSITTPTPYQSIDLAYSSYGEQLLSFYMPFLIQTPSATLGNYAGSMTCGGRISDGNGIYHYDCVTTKKTGTYSPTFSIGGAAAKMYYNYTKYDSYLKSTTSVPSTLFSSYTFPTASTSYSLTATASPDEQNASCGTAAKAYTATETSYSGSFCNTGTAPTTNPSFPVVGGSKSWTCAGIACGTSVTCKATRAAAPVNGACGTAAKAYTATSTAFSGTYCSAGSVSPSRPVFPAAGSSTTWSCNGANGGTNTSCTATRAAAAKNGSCGTANGTATYTIPTTNLCTYTASTTTTVSGTGPWTWVCTGSNGGTTASCSAPKKIDGSCGTAAKSYISTETAFSGTMCSNSGITTPATVSFPSIGSSSTWTCSGQNGGIQSGTCTASRTAAIVNGSCGTAAKTYTATETSYSGTFCAAGISSPSSPVFPSQGSSISWICQGQNGGVDSSSCIANRSLPVPIPGECGPAAGNYASTSNSFAGAFCNSDGGYTPTSILFPPNASSTTWTCLGKNNGENVSCSATRGALTPLNLICEAYQPISASNATSSVIVNNNMQWRIEVTNPSPEDTTYNIASYPSGTFGWNGNKFYINQLYQQTGTETFWASLTGASSGRTGSCAANINVILGDQIIIER